MLILGVRSVCGEYEGRQYENVYITFEKLQSRESLFVGTCCEVVKFKGTAIKKQLQKLGISLSELVGQDYEVACDRYGNPSYLI